MLAIDIYVFMCFFFFGEYIRGYGSANGGVEVLMDLYLLFLFE